MRPVTMANSRNAPADRNARNIPMPPASSTTSIDPRSVDVAFVRRSRRTNGSSAANAHQTAIQNGIAPGPVNGSGITDSVVVWFGDGNRTAALWRTLRHSFTRAGERIERAAAGAEDHAEPAQQPFENAHRTHDSAFSHVARQ